MSALQTSALTISAVIKRLQGGNAAKRTRTVSIRTHAQKILAWMEDVFTRTLAAVMKTRTAMTTMFAQQNTAQKNKNVNGNGKKGVA
jgi:hypothetical protein